MQKTAGSAINLASKLADEVANGHNQHRIIFIEGKTGTGKSNAGLVTAYETSIEFADILGGKPEDYFTVDNVAIITEEELLRVGESIKKFGIYILDDIGVGFSARDWNSKGNKIIGYILQTFRTMNNVLIMTAPDREFIDKIGRNLLHYKILMTNAIFDYGVSLGNISSVKKKYHKDTGGNMYPFIRDGNDVYTHIMFPRVPDHISVEYEKRREAIQAQMQRDKFEELRNELLAGKDEVVKKDDLLVQRIIAIREKYPELNQRQIAKKAGTNQSKVSRTLREVHMDTDSFNSQLPICESY